MTINRSEPGIVVLSFPDRGTAARAFTELRREVDRRDIVAFDERSSDPADTARHVAAGRAAANSALVSAAVTFALTLAVALSGTIAASPTLAIGTTLAITGAPFAGALAGFAVAMHRWPAGPATVHAGHGASRRPFYVAVRSADPTAVAQQFGRVSSSDLIVPEHDGKAMVTVRT